MHHGITIEVVWFDQDLFEIRFACSNGRFAGATECYVGYDDLPQLVETLRGFPESCIDRRQVQLGAATAEYAHGGVWMSFYCSDPAGHAVVEVKLRAEGCASVGEMESVAMRVPIEAAGLDSFLAQLAAMPIAVGARSVLPMAT